MRLRRRGARGRSAARGLSEVERLSSVDAAAAAAAPLIDRLAHPPPLSPSIPTHTEEKEALYHLLAAEGDAAMEMKLSATSAASSLALLRFLPSYQNLAWWIAPLTVTRLDQAVRPPIYLIHGQHIWILLFFSLLRSSVGTGGWVVAGVSFQAGLPLLSETIWKEGEAIWYSRHASGRKY